MCIIMCLFYIITDCFSSYIYVFNVADFGIGRYGVSYIFGFWDLGLAFN